MARPYSSQQCGQSWCAWTAAFGRPVEPLVQSQKAGSSRVVAAVSTRRSGVSASQRSKPRSPDSPTTSTRFTVVPSPRAGSTRSMQAREVISTRALLSSTK